MKVRIPALLTALTALFVPALFGQNVTLPNNVPSWAKASNLTGPANPQNRVVVTMYLNVRNESGLRSLIHDLYTPGSPRYRQFLTAAQFHDSFSPSAADVQAVQSFLSQRGLNVTNTPASGMFVDAVGSVQQVEQAFQVTENEYQVNGQNLRANAQAPTIPASLAGIVNFIGGLDESVVLVHPYLRNGENAPPGIGFATPGPCSTFWGDHTATVTPAAFQFGSFFPWVPCGYDPAQIRAAYGVSSVSQTGAGVRVGITDAFASPTIMDDINRFSANHGLPPLNSSNFQQITVPGTLNFPPNPFFDPQGWYGEESLDIEWVHAMAPGATIIYAGAQNSELPLDHALEHLIDNQLADIITNSWGIFGDTNFGLFHADEFAFMQAAAEGISVTFSSGDDGDVAAITGLAQGSWPATSPFVTAVGGTSLALTSASGAKNEWGWGTYRSVLQDSIVSSSGTTVTGTAWSPWPPIFFGGSGGGLSVNFAEPSYQVGVVPSVLTTTTVTATGSTVTFSSPHRVTPDISLDADPNTGVLYGQSFNISGDPLIDAGCTKVSAQLEYCERRIGGTSVSSPLFAGILALVNQARFAAGKGPIGFVNPALYAIKPGSIGGNAAVYDILPPSAPTGALRDIENSSGGITTTFRTINAVPVGTKGQVIEGADTSLRTTQGWDNVTGLGVPNTPALVTNLSQQ